MKLMKILKLSMRCGYMAIRLYDEAIYEKIKKWVKDPNMRVLSPNESSRLFQLKADQTDDKPIKLPLIAISRGSNIDIATTKRALTEDGQHIYATEDRSLVLNAIPMELSYQLDIYCKYFNEADEYLRNFLFNLINYPKISIEIPYKIMRVTSVLPSIGGHKQGIGWCIGGIAFSAMLFASSFLDLKKK